MIVRLCMYVCTCVCACACTCTWVCVCVFKKFVYVCDCVCISKSYKIYLEYTCVCVLIVWGLCVVCEGLFICYSLPLSFIWSCSISPFSSPLLKLAVTVSIYMLIIVIQNIIYFINVVSFLLFLYEQSQDIVDVSALHWVKGGQEERVRRVASPLVSPRYGWEEEWEGGRIGEWWTFPCGPPLGFERGRSSCCLVYWMLLWHSCERYCCNEWLFVCLESC